MMLSMYLASSYAGDAKTCSMRCAKSEALRERNAIIDKLHLHQSNRIQFNPIQLSVQYNPINFFLNHLTANIILAQHARPPLVMLNRRLRPWRILVPVTISHILPRAAHTLVSHDIRRVKVSQASVVFNSPHHATPDNLLASIKPLSVPSAIEGLDNSFEQAILLFTPTFAQCLAYDAQFLPKLLNHLFKRLPERHKDDRTEMGQINMDVTVAVVDRLPLPSYRSSRNPPLGDQGYEGMSYLVSARPELGVTNATTALDDLDLDHTKTLSLRVGVDVNTEVRIPLASTVFQAGQASMLSLSSWDWKRSEDQYVLQLAKSESPQHVSFNYPFVSAAKIKIPLLPLTPPRKIVAGMGNVIRQIEGDTDTITASHELEPAVSSYFVAKDLSPSAVNVWALVIPSNLYLELQTGIEIKKMLRWLIAGSEKLDAEKLKAVWQRDSAPWSQAWPSLLLRGARLHRVLSGGGGWGKKAGLISLDPDSDFKTPPSADLGAVFANSDLFETQEGMLGNAAKIGDFVQFYIAPENSTPPLLPGVADHGLRLEIGTIPSTVDTMPFTQRPGDGDEPPPLGTVYHGHFGFMSEKGISLAKLRTDSDSLQQPEWRTKLTIPLSRLSWGRHLRESLFVSSEGNFRPTEDYHTSHEGQPPEQTTKKESKTQRLLKLRRTQRLSKLRRTQSLPEDFKLSAVDSPIVRTLDVHENAQWKTLHGKRDAALALHHAAREASAQRKGIGRMKRSLSGRLEEVSSPHEDGFPPSSTQRHRVRKIAAASRVRKIKLSFLRLRKIHIKGRDLEPIKIGSHTVYSLKDGAESRLAPKRVPRLRRVKSNLRIRTHMSQGISRKIIRHVAWKYPRKVTSVNDSKAAWTLLRARRKRGKMGVKMRERYEEGLETALIRKHFSMDDTWKEPSAWDTLRHGNVRKEETREGKVSGKEKGERDQRETEEILHTVRELLKGF